LQGEPPAPYLRYFRRRSGEIFAGEAHMVLVRDLNGQPMFIQKTVRDVTDRMKAEQAQNRLLAQVQHSHAELRALTFRLEEVRESERRELAAELHDQVGQNLTGLSLNLQVVHNQLDRQRDVVIANRLADSLKLVEETTRQVRGVMAELHPPVLDEYGLVAALRWYAVRFSERVRVPTAVMGDELQPRLAPAVEMAVFRIIQEALNNVAKHAQATRVTIWVEATPQTACFRVEDDGCGFDPRLLNDPAGQPRWGMLNMQHRAAAFKGKLTIDSTPGHGARLSLTFPRPSHDH
jgi:signal transduction histidine kinase